MPFGAATSSVRRPSVGLCFEPPESRPVAGCHLNGGASWQAHTAVRPLGLEAHTAAKSAPLEREGELGKEC